jgi:hypothetical protein
MGTYNFPATSRYYGIDTLTFDTPNGPVSYLDRRFLPPTDEFALLQTYTVKQGDRLDLISYNFLGDPLAFWRIADANGAMRPDDLVATPGSTLLITLPQGVPGTPGTPNA